MVKEGAEYWDRKPVSEFFTEYRKEITDAIKEYPKIEYNGIKMLANSSYGDMPFVKEYLQSKLYNEIFGEDLILLPRFAKNFIREVFGVRLEKGSFADGVSAIVDGDKFVEFKICSSNKLNTRLRDTDNPMFDIGFISTRFVDYEDDGEQKKDSINKITKFNSQLKLRTGYKGYVVDVETGDVFEINKGAQNEPPRVTRNIWFPINEPNNLLDSIKEYTYGNDDVKSNTRLNYDEYRSKEIISENPDIAERSAEEAEMTKKKEKPIFYSIAEESGSDEEIQKASNLVADIIIGSMTDRQLTDFITGVVIKVDKVNEYLKAFTDDQKKRILEIIKERGTYAT